jgi:general secretion pathway protein E
MATVARLLCATHAQQAMPSATVGASSLIADASPVVQFVDNAVIRAYREGASDIHFENNRLGVGIKYRLDGVMAPGERLDDPQRAEEVISRIKVMAQLDITERRRPQDGRIHWSRAGHDTIDLRVSIMPSIFGEDAVLRLLDKAQLRRAQQSMSLDVLGFDITVAGTIRALAARPHGMLLVTGPTGSGKTTTVYAALSEVNDGLEKIVTIEDPVEYELAGVLQIPVNEQKGLTFATGLRSILRHDPDKIMVGEIRDSETAEIAVQSSLTGHLVFTTVHANSLFDVLGRFQHFGIDPFALASALNGVVVQRLLRKLCPQCTQWRAPTVAELTRLTALDLECPGNLPVAVGCAQCRNTGYRGRFVVAEVHDLSDAVRDLIVRKASMSELKSVVYREPSNRLLAQALIKVGQGVTTLEEVTRVVGLV